jgi:hypothetical protein
VHASRRHCVHNLSHLWRQHASLCFRSGCSADVETVQGNARRVAASASDSVNTACWCLIRLKVLNNAAYDEAQLPNLIGATILARTDTGLGQGLQAWYADVWAPTSFSWSRSIGCLSCVSRRCVAAATISCSTICCQVPGGLQGPNYLEAARVLASVVDKETEVCMNASESKVLLCNYVVPVYQQGSTHCAL